MSHTQGVRVGIYNSHNRSSTAANYRVTLNLLTGTKFSDYYTTFVFSALV